MPANSRWDLIRRLRVNEMLADFLGFIRYVPFPVFTSSLTKNRRTNTKEMEEKNHNIRLIHPFQIFSQKHVHLFTAQRGENYY